MKKKPIPKKDDKHLHRKNLLFIFGLMVMYGIVVGFLIVNLLFGSQEYVAGLLLGPPEIPVFLIVFISGFVLLCLIGWFIALRAAYTA
ncbi:hypothetical protein J4453_02370 [Candidatus Woesearchaeota archaeon]|nr:hypothetical protein [Candidatus Woesearchaeota archaeon]